MTKSNAAKKTCVATKAVPQTKKQQVIDLLKRNTGATLEEMASIANWLPHSTRAFLTGLKKKRYTIASEKTDGVRRYHVTSSLAACDAK